jgi:hypothetical protein
MEEKLMNNVEVQTTKDGVSEGEGEGVSLILFQYF